MRTAWPTRARLGLALGFAASLLLAAAASAARDARPLAGFSAQPNISSNWAGYVAIGPGSTVTTASPSMSYTDVTGEWVEPKASCTGAATSVALWVGLGGYSVSSQELEQTGTSADCAPDGTPSYYAWYELVPADSVTVKLRVDPGDTITSSVVVNGSNVLVQVINRTRHTRFTKRLTMVTPDLSSAEWIAEAPAECGSQSSCLQVALTNFGSVSFEHTYAIGNALSGTITSPNWSASAIQLVPQAHRYFGHSDPSDASAAGAGAMPLGLAADGSGFTIDFQPNAASGT